VRITRIHIPGALHSGSEVALPEAAARHVVRVLRLAPGAPLVLFDGTGGEYAATLVATGKRHVMADVGAFTAREVELPLPVVLAQAVSRGDRMDLTVQKAVELGVAHLAPLVSERSAPLPSGARLGKRLAHWRGIVASACEQCGRNRLPPVDTPRPLGAWLADVTGGRRLLLDTDEGTPLSQVAAPTREGIVVLVGPEGGFSAAERDSALAHGFMAVSLGPRVLRTETAALAVLAQMQGLWMAGG